MIYNIDEVTYKMYKGYTFKVQLFLNNNNRLVYCFVAVKNDAVKCLLQSSFHGFTKDEKDKAINDFLKSKKKQNNKDYLRLSKNAKEIVELISYKTVK